eukprot:2790055-Rhodomonas_salina.1
MGGGGGWWSLRTLERLAHAFSTPFLAGQFARHASVSVFESLFPSCCLVCSCACLAASLFLPLSLPLSLPLLLSLSLCLSVSLSDSGEARARFLHAFPGRSETLLTGS